MPSSARTRYCHGDSWWNPAFGFRLKRNEEINTALTPLLLNSTEYSQALKLVFEVGNVAFGAGERSGYFVAVAKAQSSADGVMNFGSATTILSPANPQVSELERFVTIGTRTMTYCPFLATSTTWWVAITKVDISWRSASAITTTSALLW
jgi:hypothetical protein